MASFFRWATGTEDGSTWNSSAANAWMSRSGIHGAPRLASMSPGSTSSGWTARKERAAGLSGREFGADVAGEISVASLPGPIFRGEEDQIAQLGDNLCFGLAV